MKASDLAWRGMFFQCSTNYIQKGFLLPDSAITAMIYNAGYTGIYFAGFDTGMRDNVACATIDIDGKYVFGKLWKLDTKLPLEDRFATLSYNIYDMFSTKGYMYVAAGIEEPWVGPNKQTAIKLAKVWGIIFNQYVMQTITTIGIQPATAKKAMTGNAKAKKPEVKRYAELLAERKFDQHDESDAYAIALATRSIIIERAMKEIKNGS